MTCLCILNFFSTGTEIKMKKKGYPVSCNCKPPHPWDAIALSYWFQRDVINAFNKAFGKKGDG